MKWMADDMMVVVAYFLLFFLAMHDANKDMIYTAAQSKGNQIAFPR